MLCDNLVGCYDYPWMGARSHGGMRDVQIRKPRKKRRVMGCELNRQLSSPGRACRAGSSMVMVLIKECLEMEFQCLESMKGALYGSYWRGEL